MNRRKFTPRVARLEHIQSFLSSGKSKKIWCQENKIVLSTFSITKADSPKALIPKSMVSLDALAYILNQKYTNAMPLYRQEQEFRRYGLELNRQNLSSWMIKGAGQLKPLMQEMKQELLSNELLHADETMLEVLRETEQQA